LFKEWLENREFYKLMGRIVGGIMRSGVADVLKNVRTVEIFEADGAFIIAAIPEGVKPSEVAEAVKKLSIPLKEIPNTHIEYVNGVIRIELEEKVVKKCV